MSSMLKKKSAFKPKVAGRRPAAPAASSQVTEGSESVELISKTSGSTPGPSGSESTASAQTQQPVTEAAPADPPRRDNAPQETEAPSPSTSPQSAPASKTPPPSKTPAPTLVDAIPSPETSTTVDSSDKTRKPLPSSNRLTEHPSTTLLSSITTLPITPSSSIVEPLTRSEPATVQSQTASQTTDSTKALASAAGPTNDRPDTTAAAAAAQARPIPIPSVETNERPQTVATALSLSAQQLQGVTPPVDDNTAARARSTIEAAGESENPGPSAAKPKRARKRNASDDQDGSVPKKRARKNNAAAASAEGQESVDGQAVPKPKRVRKKKSPVTEDANANQDGQASKTPGRQRSVTPEDAENETVDPAQVKMADLTKDMRIGKKFSLHDELVERAKVKRKAYYERRKSKMIGGNAAEGEGSQSGTPAPEAGDASAPAPGESSGSGGKVVESDSAAPQFQIVDGQIVLDARSLQVDRHARAAAAAGEMEEEEENEFSRHVTSATYLKRSLKPNQWTLEETEMFYKALASFGTDFDTISRMFPGKLRRHVKLKFNREERERPNRINAALIGPKTTAMMDIDEYKVLTGLEYETTEAITEELAKAEQEFADRQKREEEEAVEEARQRREALFGGGPGDSNGDAAGGDNSIKGKQPKKKKVSKRKQAQMDALAMAGEELVEDL